jgi:hypothetical protein
VELGVYQHWLYGFQTLFISKKLVNGSGSNRSSGVLSHCLATWQQPCMWNVQKKNAMQRESMCPQVWCRLGTAT